MFGEFHCDLIKEDPLFRSKLFSVFGDLDKDSSDYLFHVREKKCDCRYVIIDYDTVIHDSWFIHKAATYVYYHPTEIDGKRVVYFIGDKTQGKELSDTFRNQITKLVSREEIESWYPNSLDEIKIRIVNYLCDQQHYYGQVFNSQELDLNMLFFCPVNRLSSSEVDEQISFIKNELIRKNIIELIKGSEDLSGNFSFVLSNEGIEKYQTSSLNTNSREAFIAIKFTEDKSRINAIKKAITDAGFVPVVMNEVQTNNWIMPEIFSRIKKSRFVVVDFSVPCEGAYYEAGYAAALNKEVIHLFDEREKENGATLHFDISQKSSIFYKSFDELHERLKDRIKATID